MAAIAARIAPLALALVIGACDGRPPSAARGSITVKLPPARPAASTPGFSFESHKRLRTG